MEHDEFEFKPITEGLGFHKKVLKLKEEMEFKEPRQEPSTAHNFRPSPAQSTNPQKSVDQVSKLISSIPSFQEEGPRKYLTFAEDNLSNILDKQSANKNLLTKTLSRVETKAPVAASTARVQIPSAITETLGASLYSSTKKKITEVIKKSNENPYVESQPHAMSMIFDLVVVFGLSNLFIAAMLFVTGVDFSSVISGASTEFMAQMSLAVLFLALYTIYMTVSRSVYGYSLGEWAFDIRLGTQEQFVNSAMYPLKAAFRSTLNIVTGVITLPLLSWILKTDAAELICGVGLYRRRQE